MNPDHCATCGKRRGFAVRRQWFNITDVIEVKKHLPLKPGRAEHEPQLIIALSISRNGGTGEQTHLCDDCVELGLRLLRDRINTLLDDVTTQPDAITEG